MVHFERLWIILVQLDVNNYFWPPASRALTFFLDKKVSKKSSQADPAFAHMPSTPGTLTSHRTFGQLQNGNDYLVSISSYNDVQTAALIPFLASDTPFRVNPDHPENLESQKYTLNSNPHLGKKTLKSLLIWNGMNRLV